MPMLVALIAVFGAHKFGDVVPRSLAKQLDGLAQQYFFRLCPAIANFALAVISGTRNGTLF